MKKIALLMLLTLGSFAFCMAQEGAKSGYRGFVDLGYTIGVGGMPDRNQIALTTSHGYQFNPYFYAGLGAGVNYYHDISKMEIPIFADFRTDILNNWITPYAELRVGYAINNGARFFVTPIGGCRFNFNKIALNIGVGYTLQKLPSHWYGDGTVDYNFRSNAVCVKLGLDF